MTKPQLDQGQISVNQGQHSSKTQQDQSGPNQNLSEYNHDLTGTKPGRGQSKASTQESTNTNPECVGEHLPVKTKPFIAKTQESKNTTIDELC